MAGKSGKKVGKDKKDSKKTEPASSSSSKNAASRHGRDIFGLPLTSWLAQQTQVKPVAATRSKDNSARAATPVYGRVVLVGAACKKDLAPDDLDLSLTAVAPWQWERAARRRGDVAMMLTSSGPLWLLQLPRHKAVGPTHHDGLLDSSPVALARDLVGQALIMALDYGLTGLQLEAREASDEEQRGALIGVELASYRFKQVRQHDSLQDVALKTLRRPPLDLKGFKDSLITEASALGVATNVARHLVNLPAGDLNPSSYAAAVTALFAGSKTTSVKGWKGDQLLKERCGLLHAVGRAAPEPAALVRLSYRPARARHARPIALVGKGVTFDTGGIDIKDADGMRLMKKDMGGSATLAGLAFYLESSGSDVACDIYLALAENAIDGQAFRPGDIITARNGQTVEIHNTDAEGRLVLADAIDVAITQTGSDAPLALIDVATLTGAMRVALGTRIAGLFANDDKLADQLLAAGQKAGDPCWRMPLVKEYSAQLRTVFADVANASQSRFGGAITAALFLQRFIGDMRWCHLDLYAWTEGGIGGLAEPGGSGQGVQALAHFLEHLEL